tara:strand:+ start:665 stop:820 length:156 start_codon:yes stop_codon:yes gene_type:complete
MGGEGFNQYISTVETTLQLLKFYNELLINWIMGTLNEDLVPAKLSRVSGGI